ncbi:MAG: hypothetical protein ACRC4V_15090 [Aeromonas veronii]
MSIAGEIVVADGINKEELNSISVVLDCNGNSRLSAMELCIGVSIHCFALFDDQAIEKIGVSVLEEMSELGKHYFPMTKRIRNEWFHHAFKAELNHISAYQIAKKYGLGTRYVFRTIAGCWK